MKQTISIIVILIISLFIACNVNAQVKVKLDDNGNYISAGNVRSKDTAKSTGRTYKDSKGIIYPVYISVNKKLFIIRISRKTGNPYKYYLNL